VVLHRASAGRGPELVLVQKPLGLDLGPHVGVGVEERLGELRPGAGVAPVGRLQTGDQSSEVSSSRLGSSISSGSSRRVSGIVLPIASPTFQAVV